MNTQVNDWTIEDLGINTGYTTQALNKLYSEQSNKRSKQRLSKRKTRAMLRQPTTQEV
jgi:hypothetical protein